MLFRVLLQAQGQDLLAVAVDLIIGIFALAQLILQHPNLGAQDLVPLGPGQLVPDLAFHLVLKAQNIALPGQEAVELAQPDKGSHLLENLLLVRVAQGDVLRNEVRQISHVPAVHHRGDHLVGHAAHQLDILAELIPGLPQQGLGPGALLEGLADRLLFQQLHVGLQERCHLPEAAQTCPLPALHHNPHRGVGQAQNLRDMGDGTHGIQVLLLRFIDADLPLGHQENLLVRLHGPLQRRNGDGALHVKGQIHMWENRQAPQGQNGNIQCCRFHGGIVLSWESCKKGDAAASPLLCC